MLSCAYCGHEIEDQKFDRCPNCKRPVSYASVAASTQTCSWCGGKGHSGEECGNAMEGGKRSVPSSSKSEGYGEPANVRNYPLI
ncbi:MAG: hypothetical protein ABA06_01015 [Parcubacteria bacterium C7867-001]|nr:MAG: hypothetical protein ABA06_01015 [Parcubacteria bacterium C7867-001]